MQIFWIFIIFQLKASPFVERQVGLRSPLSLMTLAGLWPWYPGSLTHWFSTMFYLIIVFLTDSPSDWLMAFEFTSTWGMKPLYPGIWWVTYEVPIESSLFLCAYLTAPAGKISLGLSPVLPYESPNSVKYRPLEDV